MTTYRELDVLVSDLLTRCPTAQIFYDLLRGVDSIYSRLSDESQKTIILAPCDRAMVQLPRKPWETLDDFAQFGLKPYEGDEGTVRAQQNIERFVMDHAVDGILLLQDVAYKNISGGEVRYKIGDHLDYQLVSCSVLHFLG
jgi:hypothetical protein